MRRDLNGEYRFEGQLLARGGEKNDTLELSFSSELPVERGGYREILSHDPNDVDLSRLQAGDHPLLLNHDPDKQIGVVSSARVDRDRRGRANVVFSNSQLAQEVLQDVKQGIRRLVSVGYRRLREVGSDVRDGVEYVRFAWQPYEISIVSVPADPTVGIGRSRTEPLIHSMPENTPQNQEQVRVTEIQAIGRMMAGKIPNLDEICNRAILDGTSLEDLRKQLLQRLPNVKPVSRPTLDLQDMELKRYSLSRALLGQVEGKLDGIEAEASQEIARQTGRRALGFYVPNEVLWGRADNMKGTASLGGNLVGTQLMAGEFIEVLRNKLVVGILGGRFLPNLVGDLALPRQDGTAVAYWVDEADSTTQSTPNFAQVAMTPKCCTGFVKFSRKLLVQSSPQCDMLLKDDLVQVLGVAIDRAALHGAGGLEPIGIAGTTGVATIALGTNGAKPDFSALVEMESKVSTSNADSALCAYATNPLVRGVLKTTPKTTLSGASGFIWERANNQDYVNGYRALASMQVASNLTKGTATTICSAIVFGDWSSLVVGLWGGTDVIVDEVTEAGKRLVGVYAHQFTDVGIRRPTAFCYVADALTS